MEIGELVKLIEGRDKLKEEAGTFDSFKKFRDEINSMYEALEQRDDRAFESKIKGIVEYDGLLQDYVLSDIMYLIRIEKEVKILEDKANDAYRKSPAHQVEVYKRRPMFYHEPGSYGKYCPIIIKDTTYFNKKRELTQLEERVKDIRNRQCRLYHTYERAIKEAGTMRNNYKIKNYDKLIENDETCRLDLAALNSNYISLQEKSKLSEEEKDKTVAKLEDEIAAISIWLKEYQDKLYENYVLLNSRITFEKVVCPRCKGRGEDRYEHQGEKWRDDCPNCSFHGWVSVFNSLSCPYCCGTGSISAEEGVTDCLDCINGRIYS